MTKGPTVGLFQNIQAAMADVADDRPSEDQQLMEMARIVSQRGTCPRLRVGCVFSLDGRPIASGYNGVLPGDTHCVHETWVPGTVKDPVAIPDWVTQVVQSTLPGNEVSYGWGGMPWHLNNGEVTVGDTQPPCTKAVHAEINAIAFAARHGIALEGADLHVTHQPCPNCARAIVQAGIYRVIYDQPYRDVSGVEILKSGDVQVFKLDK